MLRVRTVCRSTATDPSPTRRERAARALPTVQSARPSPTIKGSLRRSAPLTAPPVHYIGTYGEAARLWSSERESPFRVVLLFQVKE